MHFHNSPARVLTSSRSAWVRSAHNDSSDDLRLDTQVTPLLLPKTPQTVRPATHNSHPSPRPGAPAGRRFDHAREAAPPLPNTSPVETASRWRAFALASKYPDLPASAGRSEVASPEWIRSNFNDLDSPWEPAEPMMDDPEKQPGFWLFSHSKRKSRLHKFHVRLSLGRAATQTPMTFRVFLRFPLVCTCVTLALRDRLRLVFQIIDISCSILLCEIHTFLSLFV